MALRGHKIVHCTVQCGIEIVHSDPPKRQPRSGVNRLAAFGGEH
jgi:hypothetical protein